jgi:hypothetical protein
MLDPPHRVSLERLGRWRHCCTHCCLPTSQFIEPHCPKNGGPSQEVKGDVADGQGEDVGVWVVAEENRGEEDRNNAGIAEGGTDGSFTPFKGFGIETEEAVHFLKCIRGVCECIAEEGK